MQEMTGFRMKDCSPLFSSGFEKIFTCTDKCVKHFLRQSIKRAEAGASNQVF